MSWHSAAWTPADSAAAAGAAVIGLSEQPLAKIAERVREQAGHMHLGDAELLADLCLSHVTVEAHQQDPLLAPRQLVPVRRDRLHVERVLHARVHVANRGDFWRATRAAGHWPLTGGYLSS